MAKFIVVNAVTGPVPPSQEVEDDLGEVSVQVQSEPTRMTFINAEQLRSFSERKPHHNGTPRLGTRLVFENKTAMPVSDTVQEIVAKLLDSNTPRSMRRAVGSPDEA